MRRTLTSVVKVLLWVLVLSWSGLVYFIHRFRSCETSVRNTVPRSVADVQETFPRPSDVKETFPRPSDVQQNFPRPSDVKETFPRPSDVKQNFPRPSDVEEYFPRPSDVQQNFPRPSRQVMTRLDRLYSGCHSEYVKGYRLRNNQTKQRYDYSRKANISVCSVPKAGSTLFTLVLLAVEVPGGTDIDKIFQMKRSHAHAQSGRYLRKSYKQNVQARNIIVARDPYRRLFSAYVDKEMLRLPIHDVNSSKLLCGNHLTFDRFLGHIVSKGLRGGFIDRHYAPISLLCETCETKYEFVAKQETLTDDITVLLENITVVPKYTRESIIKVLHGEVNARTLIGVIDTVVQAASDTCSNLLDYVSSLWSVFKIQGILRNDTVFPREYLEQLSTVDVGVVTSVVQHAIALQPLTSEDRNKQRRHALVTAYSRVSAQTIRGIQDMFFKDFVLFDYDIQPPS